MMHREASTTELAVLFNFLNNGYQSAPALAEVINKAKEYNAKHHSDQAGISSIEISITRATVPTLNTFGLVGYMLDSTEIVKDPTLALSDAQTRPPLQSLVFLNIGQQTYLVGLPSPHSKDKSAYFHPLDLNTRHSFGEKQDTISLPVQALNTDNDSWEAIAHAILLEAKVQQSLIKANRAINPSKMP